MGWHWLGASAFGFMPWSAFLLLGAWLVLGLFLFGLAPGLLQWIAGAKTPLDYSHRDLERGMVRRLGLYLLAIGAAEVAHVVVHDAQFIFKLRNFGRVWIEPAPSAVDYASMPAAVVKSIIGLWLTFGPVKARNVLRWTRVAGRRWQVE